MTSRLRRLRHPSALLALCLAWGCAQYQPPRFAITHLEQRGRVNGNGLRFVVMPDPGARQLEVAVRYDVGASDDPDGKAGLAHLVEHLMFDVHPEGDPQTVENDLKRVATIHNASTDFDFTHYFEIAQPEQLDSLLQLEAFRLHDGCTSISEEEFEREREVVRNEIRERAGTPEGQIERLVASAVYPAGHPYARIVGGDDAQIAGLTLADACAFMQQYYVPERATLIVAGRVDVGPAVASIEKWFGGLGRRAPAPRRSISAVAFTAARQTIDLDIDRPIVTVSWALPPIATIADELAFKEYFARLGGLARAGMSWGFSTRVDMTTLGGRGAPVLMVAIELEDIGRVDQALDFVWKAARRGVSVAAHPAEEVQRTQTALVVELESLQSRVDHIADLVQLAPDAFDAHGALLFRELDTVKRQDLRAADQAAGRALDPDRARVVIFRPSRTGITGDARAAFAFQPPEDRTDAAAGDAEDAAKPVEIGDVHDAVAGATRYELANGLRVVLLPITSTLPVMTAELVFDAGPVVTPENPRLADAAARFAEAPPQYLVRMARAGMGIGCSTTPDTTTCTVRTVGTYLGVALEGLERKFKATEYNQHAIELWQHALAVDRAKRSSIAFEETQYQLAAALFGADHPYARARRSASVGSGVTRDALYAFRDAHLRAANATIVVAGTFDLDEAKRVIQDTFGGWPRGAPSAPIPPAAPRAAPAYIGVIRDAGPQMMVSIDYAAPGGSDAEQPTRLVLRQMLDDAEVRVRERLGATYGTHTGLAMRRGPTSYSIQADVDASRAGEALTAMRGALDDLRSGTDFATRFARARREVVDGLLAESSTSEALASRLAWLAVLHEPPNHVEQLVTRVASLAPDEVTQLVATELAPAHEVVVLTADRDTLNRAFAAAGIHDARLIEPRGAK